MNIYVCMYILYKAALSGLSLEASVVTFYIYFYISLRVTVFVRLVLLFPFFLSFWVAGSFFLLGAWQRVFVRLTKYIWCVQFGFISSFADSLWFSSHF